MDDSGEFSVWYTNYPDDEPKMFCIVGSVSEGHEVARKVVNDSRDVYSAWVERH